MAIRNRTVNSVGYGLTDALTSLAPLPINANRAPIGSDSGPVGQLWCWPAAQRAWINDGIINAQSQWIEIQYAGGPASFCDLTVTGLCGATTIHGTSFGVTVDTTSSDISIQPGTGQNLHLYTTNVGTVTMGTLNAGSAVDIYAGNIIMSSLGGNIDILNGGVTGTISIADDAIASTVNIGTGAAAVKTIAIGGTGANVITIGDTQVSGSVSIGAAMIGGTINIGGTGAQTGTITIGGGTGTQGVLVGTSGDKFTVLGSTGAGSQTTIAASDSGLLIGTGTTNGTAGFISMIPQTGTVASGGSDTVTVNSRVIKATYTGYTTGGGLAQTVIVASSEILTTSACFITITNLNASGNGALVALDGTIQATGSLTIQWVNTTVANALGAGDSVIITVWVLN